LCAHLQLIGILETLRTRCHCSNRVQVTRLPIPQRRLRLGRAELFAPGMRSGLRKLGDRKECETYAGKAERRAAERSQIKEAGL
jgi:hypothetical protein